MGRTSERNVVCTRYKFGHYFLKTRFFERNLKFVAFNTLNSSIAEFLMKHAFADHKAGHCRHVDHSVLGFLGLADTAFLTACLQPAPARGVIDVRLWA